MGDAVKIVECPRDAWQGLPAQIPPEVKAAYLRKLIAAGFTHIDAVVLFLPRRCRKWPIPSRCSRLLDAPERRGDHRDRGE